MKRLVLLIALATVFIVNLYCAEKYAVLICGSNPEDEALQPQGQFGGIDRHRFKEFWYDTYLMWEMLRGIGYTEENIFVIFGNNFDDQGNVADWTHPNMSPRYTHPDSALKVTDYIATHDNISTVLSGFALGDDENNIPQLLDDDFLFVWTFDHGTADTTVTPYIPAIQIVALTPEDPVFFTAIEMRDYLNNIHCQKKVVWTQNCGGGAFINYLNNNGLSENLIINTSCTGFGVSVPCDDIYLSQGIPLYIDGLENEHIPLIGGEDYTHGEFDFHMYSVTSGLTPNFLNHYNGELLSSADTNSDGTISVWESKSWEQLHKSGPEEPDYWEIDSVNHYLGSTTSLEYPNLIFEDIDENTSIKGIVAITDNVSICNNSVLTINSGTKLYLKNANRLVVDAGSTIIIEDNVHIFGETATQFENTPQEIVGNRIIVNGSASIGPNVLFTALKNQTWDGLYLYGTGQSELIDVTFENCNLFCANGSLSVRDSDFDQSLVKCSGASMNFRDCTITGKMSFNNALEVR